MKARHWVTLGVVLVSAVLLGGIFLRLRDDGAEEDGAGDPSVETAEDSVREAVRSTAAQAAFATEIAVPVEGARVRRDTFVLWVDAAGRAAALRSAPLAAQVAGPVVEVPVQEGERVADGDLLVRIDPAEYRLGVQEARAQLEQAEANYEELTLFDERIEDATLREERRRQARIRAGLASAEAGLEQARYELAKTEIRAPFAGRVANLTVVEGSRLRAGDSVATVVDLSRIDVDAEVLYSAIPHLEEGRRARVTFPALPGEVFTGRVVTINPLVSRESNSTRVTVRLRNPEARILPGMPADVLIAGRMMEDRTFVPKEAVVERDRRDVVFVFEPEEPGAATGLAQWKYVTTGLENEDYVEIVSAEETEVPAAGSVVLVDGHTTLTHNARVRIENHEALGDGAGSGGGGGGGPGDAAAAGEGRDGGTDR